VLLATALVLVVGSMTFERATRIAPPPLPPPRNEPLRFGDDGVARVGSSSLERRGALWVMHVAGDPVTLGYRHARLTAPIMAAGDLHMLDLFATFVPSAALRAILTAVVRARYTGVDRGFPPARRAEIYGESVAYGDRGPAFLSPYHRLVYLHALYDIALAFERSPLLGCTAFVASGAATRAGTTPGHTIVGRNFDLDVDPWFDVDKAVQIYEPEGRLAFASIAWPGMTGVVTGMNAAGMWVSVNGARAGTADSAGVPVVFTARAILEEAHTLDEAIAIATRDAPMGSHMLLLADGASGESAVVERAPGLVPAVRREAAVTVVANHYATPAFAGDPKDEFVRGHTSTLARAARMRELVARNAGRIDPATAIMILRDRRGVGDALLPLANRNAVDALIATHSVVADLTAGVLWVSEGPHTLGTYRRIDLRARLAAGGAPVDEAAGDVAPDTLLADGTIERQRLGAELRRTAERERAARRLVPAAEEYERALALRDDDHLAWRGLAETRAAAGDVEGARAAWQRVVALAPESPAADGEARRAAALPAAP
jgi:tetratricopeptide (TPR) repeat protein